MIEMCFIHKVGLIFTKLLADERIPLDIADEYSELFLKVVKEYRG